MTRDLEQCAREVLAVLQGVHQTPNSEGLSNYFKFQKNVTGHEINFFGKEPSGS